MDSGTDVEQLTELTKQFISAMELDLTTTVTEREDQYRIDLEGPDAPLMLEHKADGLESLQIILGMVASRRFDLEKRVVVDCAGHRRGREAEVIQIAHTAAEKVRSSGQPLDLSPMNPYERRLVHLALKEEEGVTSRSRGDGFMKQVRVEVD